MDTKCITKKCILCILANLQTKKFRIFSQKYKMKSKHILEMQKKFKNAEHYGRIIIIQKTILYNNLGNR